MTDRRSNVDPPHRQTCQWIFQLEEYRRWNARPSGLLWIKGKPGTGKSTLMSHLYNDVCAQGFFSPDNIICLEFFFSARGAPLQRSFIGMLRSLSSQIFKRDNGVRDLLRTSYMEKQDSFGSSKRAWNWQQPELTAILTSMILASARRKQVIIFIDALDEAGDQAAKEIAKYLHGLNDNAMECSTMVKTCISCRHYPIASLFPAVAIHVEDHNRDDIQAYVKEQFKPSNLSRVSHMVQRDWRLLIRTLVDMAAGVFQWVCLVTPMVLKYISDGDSLEQVQEYLLQVPTGLKEVYEHILKNVIDQRHRAGSLQLFQWLHSATRPLSVEELRYALAARDIVIDPLPQSKCSNTRDFVRSNDVMELRISSWSGGLVEVVNRDLLHSGTVQVIHQSVNDFLSTDGFRLLAQLEHARFQRGKCPPNITDIEHADIVAMSHGELYRSCLYYFAAEKKELLRYKPHDREAINTACPFAFYASQNMLTHAEKSQGCRGIDLRRELQLLEYVLQTWLGFAELSSVKPDSVALNVHYEYEPNGNATCLHVAAAANLTDLASCILETDGNLHAMDDSGRTALHIAAREGHLAILRLMYEAGADMTAKTNYGETPLTLAAGRGHVDAFSWLWKQIASLETSMNGLDNALRSAINDGRIAIVSFCIGAGANLNAPRAKYGSVLSLASSRGSKRIAQLLLEGGADVNAPGGQHGNALSAACFSGSEEMVQLLLNWGANVNAQGGNHGNAISTASHEGHKGTVAILLDNGADVNATGGHLGNVLSSAAYWGHADTVQLLLDRGADINAKGGLYGSALAAAAYFSRTGIMEMLLDRGADVNLPGGKYGSALSTASYRGSERAVQLLLDRGANIGAEGGEYGDALRTASAMGHKRVVQLLLSHDIQKRPQRTVRTRLCPGT